MAQVIEGRTEDAQKPFLGAEFWQIGAVVEGFVQRVFQIPGQKGNCYELCTEGVDLNGEPEETVNMSALSGFSMALQSVAPYELRVGDFIRIECTSIKEPTPEKRLKAKKEGQELSPMPYFKISITPGKGSEAWA